MRNLMILALVSVCFVGCGKNDDETISDKSKTKPGAKSTNKKGADAQDTKLAATTKPLLKKAEKHIQKRELTPAFELLNEVLRIDPKSHRARFLLGGLLSQANQSAQARAHFDKAIALDPTNSMYLNARGYLFLTRGIVDRAIKDFDAAIKIDPKYPQPYNNRGLVLLAQGKFADAINDFNVATRFKPDYTDAINNRGFTYYKAGKNDKALSDYKKVLRIDSKYVNAYFNRGLLYFKAEQYEHTVTDMTHAIAHDQDNLKFFELRRQAFLKLDKKDEAQDDATKIIWLAKLHRLKNKATQEKTAGPYVELAEHNIQGEENATALMNYETAIKTDPKYSQTYSSRAAYWLQKGDYQKAVDDCQSAVKKGPHHAAYSIMGDAYFKLNDYDNAIANYQLAKRIDSVVAQAYYSRAKARQAKGQDKLAAEDLKNAVLLDPKFEVRTKQ